MTKTKLSSRRRIYNFLKNNRESTISRNTHEKSVYNFLRQLRFEGCINKDQFDNINKLVTSKENENFNLGRTLIDVKVKEFYTLGYKRKNKGKKVVKRI